MLYRFLIRYYRLPKLQLTNVSVCGVPMPQQRRRRQHQWRHATRTFVAILLADAKRSTKYPRHTESADHIDGITVVCFMLLFRTRMSSTNIYYTFIYWHFVVESHDYIVLCPGDAPLLKLNSRILAILLLLVRLVVGNIAALRFQSKNDVLEVFPCCLSCSIGWHTTYMLYTNTIRHRT